MLKVNTNKGKFDIVLNEENLFKTETKNQVVKGRQSSKGFSSQARTLPPKTNRVKQNEKTKPVPRSQKKDADDTKNQTTTKGQASEDASYLTKDQLSKILMSLTSADVQTLNSTPGHRQHSQTQQTTVYQPLTKVDQESTVISTSESKTKESLFEDTVSKEEQANISKRNFQWKKELDEQVVLKQTLRANRSLLHKEDEHEVYDPWGRPGAGAPIRTQSGNVVADYKKMHQDISSKNDANMTSVSAFDLRSKHAIMMTKQSSNTHDVITSTTPVAMRSSFAVGAPGVVKYETYQSKHDEKKKWLQDLEQQIKEKKEREAREKMQQLQKEAKEESWNQTPTIPNESPPALSQAAASSAVTTKHESPLNVGASAVLENSFRAGNLHARGHGLQSLGDMNQDELERKRLKTLEHQRAIKEQVEEKRRLKQEEKEKRLKEEAEKEKALTAERERLQKQYRDELKRREEKEDEARRRAEALQLSILQAHESAQQEKAAKRIKHLELHGHDVSGLKSPGISPVQQHIVTDTSPENKEADLFSADYRPHNSQSSPRVTQHKEAPAETDNRHEQNASFESELREISSKMSLESEWTTSSPVSSLPNNSQAKPSPSPGNDARHVKTRSRSERSQRKKQTFKQRNKRQSSLETVKYGRDRRHPDEGTGKVSAVPPRIEDAFMIPYTRTSSATFSAVPGTPSPYDEGDTVGSRKDLTTVNRNKAALKKPQSLVTQANRSTATSLSQKTLGRQPVRKDNIVDKPSGSTRGTQRMAKQDAKKSDLSRTVEIRKDKHDKAKTQENSVVYPVQASPDRLPTARQEMILQQLAALRQGLMIKERELHQGAV